jgi:hypothetical protein
MQFIGQIALDRRIFPKAVAQMAYVFVNEQGDWTLRTPTWRLASQVDVGSY